MSEKSGKPEVADDGRVEYRCRYCKSTEVTFEATAEWDRKSQDFIVIDVWDINKHSYCGKCRRERCAEQVPATEYDLEGV